MDIDRSRIAIIVEAPDFVEQLVAGEHPVRVAGKVIDKLQLFGRSVDALAVDPELVVCQVYLELVVFDLLYIRRRGARTASENCLDARHNFLCVEGLDDIVVRAELETEDFIKSLALCGEHDYRLVREFSDFAADLPAVEAGQHYIKQHQIRLNLAEALHGALAVVHYADCVALFFKIEAQQFADINVVVNDKYFFVSHKYLSFVLNEPIVIIIDHSKKFV